jgi:3-methyladenine DNA glycosylase Tag
LTSFQTIRARTEKRKGGAEALAKLMPPAPDPKALRQLRDDRVLAEMTKRVFSAGFAWSVIESKWPSFEDAFLGFEPSRLAFEPDEFWHKLTMDARIVRNGAKIASVRENARFVLDIAKAHGSFGRFLTDWPPSNEVGLLELLAKRGSRLGGATGTDAAQVPGLRRLRGDEGRRRLSSWRRPRHRGGADIETRPRQDPRAVQRLGQRNRPALQAYVAHLRDVDWREL